MAAESKPEIRRIGSLEWRLVFIIRSVVAQGDGLRIHSDRFFAVHKPGLRIGKDEPGCKIPQASHVAIPLRGGLIRTCKVLWMP